MIGYDRELTDKIGLRASVNYPLLNGDLECELREYVIFDGSLKDMRSEGGSIKNEDFRASDKNRGARRPKFKETFDGDDRRPRHFARDDDRKPRRFARDDDRRDDHQENSSQHEDFHHTEKFARRMVQFRGPSLGKENERPVIKGRRNGWKRRDE